MAIDFSLTHFIKEAQQQHGLQTEDYARYHHYVTKRVAALRQQLHLSNEKKRFLHKEVTITNATDARHLMLLALYAERCFAAAETLQEQWQAGQRAGNTGTRPAGGVPPHDQYRKRLNKAVKWAGELARIAQAAGSAALAEECEAYHMESQGRARVAHGHLSEAKEMFLRARESYLRRYRDVATPPTAADTLRMKVSELNDRTVYCQQRLGEEGGVTATEAATTHGGTVAGRHDRSNGSHDAWEDHCVRVTGEEGEPADMDADMTTLRWNGRALRLTGMKVRSALREARSVGVETAEAKALESAGVIISVGQVNKVLELMDRRISYYNDALTHAQQDLRVGVSETSAQKTEQQLIVHYFLFSVAHEQVRRALFLARVYERRFYATERAVRRTPLSSSVSALTSASASSMQPCTSDRHEERTVLEDEDADCWMATKKMGLWPAGAAHHPSSSSMHGPDAHLLVQTKSRKSDVTPALYASPLEVIHLYRTAGEALAKMELLPGVSHRRDVQELRAVCEAGQRLFAGEGWRVSGEEEKARLCYQRALDWIDEAVRAESREGVVVSEPVAQMRARVQCALLRNTAAAHAAAAASTVPRFVNYWTDVNEDEVVAARNVVRFPPRMQAISCKPAFIDIVGTFIQYPQVAPSSTGGHCAEKGGGEPAMTRGVKAGQTGVRAAGQGITAHTRNDGVDGASEANSAAQGGKRWPWKWGWANG